MLKTNASLEIKKEDRIYKFMLPDNCNLGEVHDILFEMRNFIIGKITEISSMEKSQKDKEVSEPEKQE